MVFVDDAVVPFFYSSVNAAAAVAVAAFICLSIIFLSIHVFGITISIYQAKQKQKKIYSVKNLLNKVDS